MTGGRRIAVPSGESLTLSGDQVTGCANFYGGGALVLGQNATLSVIGEVSGSTVFTVAGTPLSRTYIQAPAATPDNAFVYAGSEEVIISIEGSFKKRSFFDDSGFKGVILTAPEGVTFSLYTGFSDGAAVTPDQVRTANGVRYQYYGALTSGRYRCVASGTGYYRETRNLFLSAAKLATRTLIDVDPGRTGGNGYEPTGNVLTMTDELYQNCREKNKILHSGENS